MAWKWGKVKIQRLRTEPSKRQQVRDKLRPQTGQLLDEIHLAFVQARDALKTHNPADQGTKYSDFVLILDQLDRIQQVGNRLVGEQSQRALFVDGGQQLAALGAHVVYTIPLALARNIGHQLTTLYSKELFVLPMIKTEHRGRDHAPYEKGRDRLTEILQRRMPNGVALAHVIEDKALAFLQKYSGGHVRNLLMFVREASLLTGEHLPIKYTAVREAIRPTVNILAGSLRDEDWKRLAELELSPDQKWDNNDPEKRRLLENLVVLEYVNGDEENEVVGAESFDEDTAWYAVNPFIRGMKSFRMAVEVLEQEKDKS
ncbi:MAG: hypothetical protein OHK0029_07260 [Armatimonadaceae bacterium]